MPLDEKNQLFKQLMGEEFDIPEVEVVQDPFTLDIDIGQAIRIIQKNDRGRQGRQRISLILKQLQAKIKQAEKLRKLREGKLTEKTEDNKENDASVVIQQRIRGILARKQVESLRIDEMQFLGMQKKKKTAEEERNDPIKLMERQRDERKSVQEGNWKSYLNAKANIKDEIEANEGTDIMEGMLKDRRDWINEYR